MSVKKSKRAPNGAGCIRLRADGRRETRYTVGIDPNTGKKKIKSLYGISQREVL